MPPIVHVWYEMGTSIAAIGGLVWGFWQRFSKARIQTARQYADDERKIILGKDELIRVQSDRADAYKVQFEQERATHLEYRNWCHEQLEKSNLKVLKATEELVELRSKTDLSPLHQHIKEQALFNEKLLETMDHISQTLQVLVQKVLGQV